MLHKFNTLFLVLGLILFGFILTSCYKEERFTFKEGKYGYAGDQFVFYNEIKIDYVSLNFISENVDDKETNILVNRKNNASYYVDIYLENDKNEGFSCNFKSLGKVGDQIDRYYIELDISNFINVENSIILMVLEIENSNYYKEDRNNFEADKIFLSIKKFTIDGNVVTEYSFPSRLMLEYVDE